VVLEAEVLINFHGKRRVGSRFDPFYARNCRVYASSGFNRTADATTPNAAKGDAQWNEEIF
jgi:hypothetical protein